MAQFSHEEQKAGDGVDADINLLLFLERGMIVIFYTVAEKAPG